MLGSIKGPDSSGARSSSSLVWNNSLVVLSDFRTRSARNGDDSNKFADAAEDDNADADADTDDGSPNEFNLDADVNNDTGATAEADDEDDDTLIRANDPCKLVLTVIGDTTSCCSVIINDDAVKDDVGNADTVAAVASAASFTLLLVHTFAFRPRCCAIADGFFFPSFGLIVDILGKNSFLPSTIILTGGGGNKGRPIILNKRLCLFPILTESGIESKITLYRSLNSSLLVANRGAP